MSIKIIKSNTVGLPSIPQSEWNPNIINSKRQYVHRLVGDVRANGSTAFWVFNKNYLEIYHFKVTQITDFDVNIDLYNSLAEEHIMSIVLVLHMKDKILELLEEVPGKVYLNRFDCYRDLYKTLHQKFETIKSTNIKTELLEKIEYIEVQFPELLL